MRSGSAPVAPASAVPAAPIAPAEPAFANGRGRGQRGCHDFGVDALLDRLALRGQLFDRGLTAQVEPALAIDLDRLDHDLVAYVRDLFRPLDSVIRELRDMDQAVLVRKDLDEHPERHDADDLALVDPADLDLVGEALDPVDRLPSALLVDGRDEDLPVVLDVDLGARLLD